MLILRKPSIPQHNATSQASIAWCCRSRIWSSDKDTGYFASGIQDEILTRLTKIGALKVISRTSTAHFASRPDNLPDIARLLGVANILEGSVQKAGNAVHVNVQLIKASTDANLWAEDYDRNLDDIFGVESEVATSIAETLNAKVTGNERQAITAKPTRQHRCLRRVSARVGALPARGRRERGELSQDAGLSGTGGAGSIRALRPPGHCSAHDNALQYFNADDATEARRTAARSAVDAALRLQPHLAEAQLAQAYFQYYVDRDYEGARGCFAGLLHRWPRRTRNW